eukprot:GHUV01004059.1.p1 GENE.GHUV01004059.1~~GHUV01004059.1.p1  ORF type:complete len:362 (+),score=97.55 GHUV01004059.1:149-1234(+)
MHQSFRHCLTARGVPARRVFRTATATSKTMVAVTFKETATQPDQRPDLPRSGHCGAAISDQEAIIFGGYTETADKQRAPTNEAWKYSSTTGSWTKVQYSSTAVPQPRLVSQAVAVGGKLWIIGGWNSSVSGPAAFLGDVWTLDLSSWAWEEVQLAGEPLQGISRFQAVAVGEKIYVHTHRTEDHILVIDTAANSPTLNKVPVKGPAPSSRGLHSVVHIHNALYLFGGAPQSGPMLGDLWKLDLQSMQWQQLQPGGPSPHVRCSTAAGVVGSNVFYFGGAFYGSSGGLEMLQDAFVYDTVNNTWVVPNVHPIVLADGSTTSATLPAGRNAAVMVPLGQQLLLHAGWRAFVETYNDSYLVTVD